MQRKAMCALLIILIILIGVALVFCGKQEEPADMDTADYASFQTVQKNMEA